jgi:hypothetical protein
MRLIATTLTLSTGEYAVVLKFAETYWQEPGRKVFHVHINDIPALSELDIFAKVCALWSSRWAR